jgi:hypothetical protein
MNNESLATISFAAHMTARLLKDVFRSQTEKKLKTRTANDKESFPWETLIISLEISSCAREMSELSRERKKLRES